MPAPVLVGTAVKDATNWHQAPGAVSGIQGTTVFYEIPYEGDLSLADTFRASWPKGSACPIAGFTQLLLVDGPTINEGVGNKGTSTLRFEGVDVNGDFGDVDPTVTVYHWDPLEIELYGTGAWKARYAFKKSVAVKTYTQTSQQSSPGSVPSGLDNPALDAKTYDYYLANPNNDEGAVQEAPKAADVPTTGFYVVTTVSRFNRITDLGTGIFEHEEWHEKTLEPIESAPPP